MNDRFKNWQYPTITEGKPTQYNWVVQHTSNFKLGYRTDIGAFTYINAKNGVTLEDGVQIGSHCSVYSVSTIDGKEGSVHFKKNCRIGSHSTIMPGVTIGENAIIGAHSFVNTDISDNVVAVGAPARIIKKADEQTGNRIFLSPPHMSGREQRFVHEAFDSNYIAPLGPQVDAFEREFSELVGIKHCVALSSGTAAIHLALKHLGVGPGDEVWASTLTFIGSVSPITFEGATPVFFDCAVDSWNLDPDLLEMEMERCARQGRLPKALIPTDLYGQCCDLPRILSICNRYDVPVICDSAEALGAKYKTSDGDGLWLHAGKGARAAVFSFNGNKIITTSGGGMLASDDAELIAHARFLSQQAREAYPHYEHMEIGFNYRMSNIVAAIGRGQLRVLADRVERKREIFDYYADALGDVPGLSFMPEAEYGRCTRWLTVILVDPAVFGVDREALRLALETENIESRPVWKPMHMQPVFATCGAGNGGRRQYPARAVGGAVSERFFEQGLCLPSGTAMCRADLERVVGIVKDCASG